MGFYLIVILLVMLKSASIVTLSDNMQAYAQRRKHVVATIKTVYGDIYDCMNIYRQPSLDHPLLKNHKIQRTPDGTLRTTESGSKRKKVSLNNGMISTWNYTCPKGTVPIPRVPKHVTGIPVERSGYGLIFAGMHTKNDTVKVVTGVDTITTIWSPEYLLDSEYSEALIAVETGLGPQRNIIQAGWSVNPGLYNDFSTRLFTSWTADNYNRTGCFNTMCPGFIVTNRHFPLGLVFHTSMMRGIVYRTRIQIKQDLKGNWWLSLQFVTLGYWPRELFTSLGNGAAEAKWGGQVYVDVGYNDPFPEMGTGYVSQDDYDMSASFSHMEFFDSKRQLVIPSDTTVEFLQNDGCYYAANHKYTKQRGFSFMYGGPYIKGC